MGAVNTFRMKQHRGRAVGAGRGKGRLRPKTAPHTWMGAGPTTGTGRPTMAVGDQE